jgi:hypothetical protein
MGEETTTSSSTSETQSEQDPKAETAITSGSSETPETTNQSPDDISRELERLKSSLKRANAEAKEHREKATELARFKEQTEAEKLSDSEKQTLAQKKLEQQLAEHQAQNNALVRELQESRINNEVFKQASKLNIIDIDAASKLIDGSRIEYDDNGNPTNIDALLKDLVKQRSWLVGKQPIQTSGGATNPPRSATSGPQTITKEYVEQVQRGGPQAWSALPEDEQRRISAFIRGGGLFKR